jgi:diacylglycerol kinase family enzyme
MTRSSEIAIVLNPSAGGGQLYPEHRVAALRAIAGAHGVLFSTVDRELVEAVADGVRERGVGTVAIIGGDGTVSSVVSALQRAFAGARLPPIALLRGGTMNTIANSLGVSRRQPEELLRRLVAAKPAEPLRRATVKVDGRVGFLFSTGIMVGFLKVLYRSSESEQGPLGALRLLGKGSWQALTGGQLIEEIETPLLATLTVDDEVHPPRRYTVLGAATVEQVGLGFRPFTRAGECADQFQVFAFHGSTQSLVRQLPRIRRGLPMVKGLGFDPVARRLQIETAGEPIAYALDGDLREGGPKVVVELGPQIEIRTF